MTNEIMSKAESNELEKLTENAVLKSALKKVFLADIYQNGTLDDKPMEEQYMRNYAFGLQFDPQTGREFARTDEEMGKAVKVCNEALRLINISFQKIDKYKKIVDTGLVAPAKHR